MYPEIKKYRRVFFLFFFLCYWLGVLSFYYLVHVLAMLPASKYRITFALLLGASVISILSLIFFLPIRAPIKVELLKNKMKVIYYNRIVYINYKDIENVELKDRNFKYPFIILKFRGLKSKDVICSYVISKEKAEEIYNTISDYLNNPPTDAVQS